MGFCFVLLGFFSFDLYLKILDFWCSGTLQSVLYVSVTGKECCVLLCSEIFLYHYDLLSFCYIFIGFLFCSLKGDCEFQQVYAEASLIFCVFF